MGGASVAGHNAEVWLSNQASYAGRTLSRLQAGGGSVMEDGICVSPPSCCHLSPTQQD